MRYETRGVLAAAYRGKGAVLKVFLTHLTDTEAPGEPKGLCGKAPNLADHYSNPKGNGERPTCPVCAGKYDRLLKDILGGLR